MTYNIQGEAASRRTDHLDRIAEVIVEAGSDVVCLQEVHCRTRRATVDQGEELAQLTGLNLSFGRSCAMDGGDYGNAILTRGEVTERNVCALPGTGEPRSLMRSDVTLDGTSFSVFVTHLSAWGRLRRRERLEQIAKVAEVIDDAALPHVLAGDFNVSPHAEEIRALMSRANLMATDPGRNATFRLTRQRLDYVFCDPRWRVVRSEVLRRGPSDHWPLEVELELEKR
ncbi:MAG TPA: endonuclease/exonuclease/phosphatase family protein [Thermoanaerobaculia bacterium]